MHNRLPLLAHEAWVLIQDGIQFGCEEFVRYRIACAISLHWHGQETLEDTPGPVAIRKVLGQAATPELPPRDQ